MKLPNGASSGGPAPSDSAAATGSGSKASGERQRSPRSRSKRSDDSAVLADTLSAEAVAMGGGGGAVQPGLIDPASLQAYLAAQAQAAAAAFPAGAGGSATPDALAVPAQQGGESGDSTKPHAIIPGLPMTRGPSGLSNAGSSSNSALDLASMAVAAGMAGLPGVAGALPGGAGQINEQWQRTLIASQDWANVLRMANQNPELASAASKSLAGGVGSSPFHNFGAFAGAGGIPAFLAGGSGESGGQGSSSMGEIASGMNPALSAQHRSASEQLLAELTNSTRAQQRRPVLPTALQQPPQQPPDGGMDELIDSLFPFTEEMSHHPSSGRSPRSRSGRHGSSKSHGGSRSSSGRSHHSKRSRTSNSDSAPHSRSSEEGVTTTRLSESSELPRNKSKSSNLGENSSERATISAEGSHSDGSGSAEGSRGPWSQGSEWWGGGGDDRSTSASSSGGDVSGSGSTAMQGYAPGPGPATALPCSHLHALTVAALACRSLRDMENRPKGSVSPTCSSNSCLSATDILQLGDELLDGV